MRLRCVVVFVLLGLGTAQVRAADAPPDSPPKPAVTPPGSAASQAADNEPRTSAEFYERALKRINVDQPD
jgi:hypothetical protein